MSKFAPWASACLLAGCTPSLSKEIIRNHPRIKIGALEAQLVEKSEPLAPVWIRRSDRGAADWVPFVGQATAESADQAKANAERDLFSAVSNFVAVEVETEFESRESESNKNGVVQSSVEAREVVKTRSASRVEGVRADQSYWEKWAASPLAPEALSFRYYLHAKVPKAEIARARVAKQLAREKQSGKRSVVLLPFRPGLTAAGVDTGPLANAFIEELSTKLGALPGIYVADPGLVRGLIGEGRSEAEAMEVVRDAFLPDVLISGAYQLHAERLRVSYAVRSGAQGTEVKSGSVDRPYPQLFELEDALYEELRAALGAARPASPGPKKSELRRQPELEQSYHLAYELYRGGKNLEAVALLRSLLGAEPRHARAQLRLGRVLERLGRYGRLVSVGGEAVPLPAPGWCIDQRRIFPGGELYLDPGSVVAGSQELPGPEEDVDILLSAAVFAASGPLPDPQAPALPSTAVAAYWNALAQARAQGDVALERMAQLALADLAVRTDRLGPAEQLYQFLDTWSTGQGDLNLRSLTRLGLGRVERARGRFAVAQTWLNYALADRAVLGEKPYLLEVLNELGGLAVEMSRYPEAEQRYRQAWRIADDLQDDYFRAILSNNLGVLEYAAGRAREAKEHFAQAFDHLRDLEEAEGQIASGLNLSLAASLGGDPQRGLAYLKEAHRLIQGTGQEGQRGAAEETRGVAALAGGRGVEALPALWGAFMSWQRLGRPADALRTHNALVVAQLQAYLSDPTLGAQAERAEVLRCLAGLFRDLLDAGYGDSSLQPRRYYPGDYGGGAYAPRAQPLGVFGSLSYLVARLNAEVTGKLEP